MVDPKKANLPRRITPTAAPNEAPADMPIIYGSAMDFAAALDRCRHGHLPTIAAKIIRGGVLEETMTLWRRASSPVGEWKRLAAFG